MTLAARLRKLEAQATPGPWETDPALSGGAFVLPEAVSANEAEGNARFIVTSRNLLPLLADLAEAAEEVRENIDEELDVLLDRVDAALARVADQLDHEEGTT